RTGASVHAILRQFPEIARPLHRHGHPRRGRRRARHFHAPGYLHRRQERARDAPRGADDEQSHEAGRTLEDQESAEAVVTMTVRELTADAEIRDAFPLMRALRDRIRPETFLAEIRRQQVEGYRLFGGFDDSRLVVPA